MSAPRPIFRHHVFVDVETTGLDPSVDELIEVGAVFVEGDEVVDTVSWLVRPRRQVPAVIHALTGLKQAELDAAQPLAALRDDIGRRLAGWTVVAHNAAFERAFLAGLLGGPVIDSCEVMHLLFPELPSHALEALVQWAELSGDDRHRAAVDARDTLEVLRTAQGRLLGAGRAADVAGLVRALSPAQSDDRRALVELLDRLAAKLRAQGAPSLPPRPPRAASDEALAGDLKTWLERGEPVAAELESDALLGSALAAARAAGEALGQTVIVAMTRFALSRAERQTDLPVLVLPERRLCRAAALAGDDGTAAPDDAERAARAYLWAWARRTRSGDVGSLSFWFEEHFPRLGPLALAAQRAADCGDEACPLHGRDATTTGAPAVLATHDAALDWAERQPGLHLLLLEAPRLADAVRRADTVSLNRAALEALGERVPADGPLGRALPARAGELETAIAEATGFSGGIDGAALVSPAWLRIREVLSSLGKDLSAALRDGALGEEATRAARALAEVASRLRAPPPPGFQLALARRALAVQLGPTPDTVRETLEKKLSRAHVVAVSDVASGAVAEWPAALGLSTALHVQRRRARPGVRVTVHGPVDDDAKLALDTAKLALAEGRSVTLALLPPLELSALADALMEAHPTADLRLAATGVEPAPGRVLLHDWRPPRALEVSGDLLVLAGRVYAVDLRRALVGGTMKATQVVVAAPTPAERARMLALLDDFEVKAAP